MNPLDLLKERHGLKLSEPELQAIVNTCIEISEIQEKNEYEDAMAAAYEESGGCSRCGDLDGFSCTCEDNDIDECEKCGDTEMNWLHNGLCGECHKEYVNDFVY